MTGLPHGEDMAAGIATMAIRLQDRLQVQTTALACLSAQVRKASLRLEAKEKTLGQREAIILLRKQQLSEKLAWHHGHEVVPASLFRAFRTTRHSETRTGVILADTESAKREVRTLLMNFPSLGSQGLMDITAQASAGTTQAPVLGALCLEDLRWALTGSLASEVGPSHIPYLTGLASSTLMALAQCMSPQVSPWEIDMMHWTE
jgi:hypothetical protein